MKNKQLCSVWLNGYSFPTTSYMEIDYKKTGIIITFSNGFEGNLTKRIVHHIRTTFFVVGLFVNY